MPNYGFIGVFFISKTIYTPITKEFSYSNYFTLACRGVIPVNSTWVVGLGRLAAESRRVSSRRCLGQIRKLFRNRVPAVSFLSRGQKRAGFVDQKRPKRIAIRPIFLFGSSLAK